MPPACSDAAGRCGGTPALLAQVARRDLLAGLAVWALLGPQALACGEPAGLSPVTGLYTAFGALLLYALAMGSGSPASRSATVPIPAGFTLRTLLGQIRRASPADDGPEPIRIQLAGRRIPPDGDSVEAIRGTTDNPHQVTHGGRLRVATASGTCFI